MPEPYSNRELDEKFSHILSELTKIIEQTTKHNGRMSRMERNLLINSGPVFLLEEVHRSDISNPYPSHQPHILVLG